MENGQTGPRTGPILTQVVKKWAEEQYMTCFNKGIVLGGAMMPEVTLSSGFSEPGMT